MPWSADEKRCYLHPPRPDDEVPVVVETGTPDLDLDHVHVHEALRMLAQRAPPAPDGSAGRGQRVDDSLDWYRVRRPRILTYSTTHASRSALT